MTTRNCATIWPCKRQPLRWKPWPSPSTLCRFEQRFDRQKAVALHKVLLAQFIQAHPRPPKRLILDFDATDTQLHGEQEGRYYNGYYDGYCMLPLYVFCDRHLLVSYLRPSRVGAAKRSLAIGARLVRARRKRWPGRGRGVRGGGGGGRPSCRQSISSWV